MFFVNLFRKIADAIRRFMYGRYGADALFYTLLGASLVCSFLFNFIPHIAILLVGDLFLLYALFRYLSRNLYKRREENRKFVAFFHRIKRIFTYERDRIRDIKKCRYRKCKFCRAPLRLPIRRGRHGVVCPRCGKRFTVRIWF